MTPARLTPLRTLLLLVTLLELAYLAWAPTAPPPPPPAPRADLDGAQGLVALESLAAWAARAGLPPPPATAVEPAVARALVEAYDHLAGNLHRPSAWGDLGRLLASVEADTSARACLARARELEPERPDWPHLLGVLAQRGGRDDQALALLGEALRLEPSLRIAHARLGDLLLAAGRPGEAVEHLERYVEAVPEDSLGHEGLARAALAQGDVPGALDAARRAAARQPGDARAWRTLAQALLAHGDGEAADQAAARARDLPQGDPFAERDPRVRELVTLVDSTHALEREFERLQSSDDWDALASLARRILERRGDDPQMLANLAEIRRRQGRLEESRELLERLVDLAPGLSGLHTRRAALLITLEDPAGALAAADLALSRDGDDLTARSIRARAHWLLKQVAEAESDLRLCLAADPSRTSDRLMLAVVVETLQRPDEALTLYRGVLEDLPDHELARAAVERLGGSP